jgi:hypothetical protein
MFLSIKGFSNYEVSNKGEVRNIVTGNTLKPRKHTGGYLNVYIKDDTGKYQNQYIHRLVALEFVTSNVNCPEVDHIDGDKTNNHYTNLRWVNRSQNSRNFDRSNRRGYKMKSINKADKGAILFLKSEGWGNTGIGRFLDIPRQTVYSFVKRS